MPKHNYDDEDDDLLMALQSMEPCGNCGAEGAKIPCMSGCGEVYYCSRECNMHHASAHRLRCRNLRCSKFNDSDSDSGSDSYEEFSDDDSDEYETDDGEDDEEEEEDAKPKKGGGGSKKKGKSKSKRNLLDGGGGGAAGGGGGRVMVDSEVERRIEEKIMRRLKKQEENRIAQAIEQRMRDEKANWRDDEMTRIIMEMRDRFQKEMSTNSGLMAQLAKKKEGGGSHSLESQSSTELLMSLLTGGTGGLGASGGGGAAAASVDNPQAEGKEVGAAAAAGVTDGARARGASQPASSWNNACRAFEALRVVVWKHSFLPRMEFAKHADTGIFNALTQMDADESFSHIALGDALISVNGKDVDESIATEEDLKDLLAGFASPLILKFEAADPHNDKVHDYTVTWSNGPLGVTLKDDCTNQKVPIVNRLTKKSGSVAVKHNIAIGDILVAINNIDTIQLGCSLSMSILKKVQLPAKLKFRGVGGPAASANGEASASESHAVAAAGGNKADHSRKTHSEKMTREPTYTVNWGEGPLGLTIIPGMEEADLPVIKKVTGTGTSKGIENAQVGDFLELMNDISTSGMQFEDVVGYLKSAPKPVMLRFRAYLGEDDDQSFLPPAPAPAAAPVPAPVAVVAVAPAVEITRKPSSKHNGSSSTSGGSTRGSSPVARSSSESTYKVLWGDGPLGLTIDAREDSTTGAYIKRIASKGAASNLSHDCIGDFLTHVNDMDVTRVVFVDIVAQLKNVPRPVTLLFRRRRASSRPSKSPDKRMMAQSSSDVPGVTTAASAHHQPRERLSDAPVRGRKPSAHEDAGIHYYNVVWQDGTPLGLSLRSADATCDYPYITRVTGNGSAAHLPNSVVNDCLVSVDGRSVHVRDKTFDEVMTMLKSMPKPVTLKFQARTQDQPRGSSSGAGSGGGRSHLLHQSPPSAPAPAPVPQQPLAQTWRQNRGGVNDFGGPPSQPPPPAGYHQPQQPLPPSAVFHHQSSNSSLPLPGGLFASSLVRQNSSNLTRSYVPPDGSAAGNEDKFANIQSPFLVQNKLSTGRRQKMLKGLKK